MTIFAFQRAILIFSSLLSCCFFILNDHIFQYPRSVVFILDNTHKIWEYINYNVTLLSSPVQYRPSHPHFSPIHAILSVLLIAVLSGIYLGKRAPFPPGEGAVFLPPPRETLEKLPPFPHWSSAIDPIFLACPFYVQIKSF